MLDAVDTVSAVDFSWTWCSENNRTYVVSVCICLQDEFCKHWKATRLCNCQMMLCHTPFPFAFKFAQPQNQRNTETMICLVVVLSGIKAWKASEDWRAAASGHFGFSKSRRISLTGPEGQVRKKEITWNQRAVADTQRAGKTRKTVLANLAKQLFHVVSWGKSAYPGAVAVKLFRFLSFSRGTPEKTRRETSKTRGRSCQEREKGRLHPDHPVTRIQSQASRNLQPYFAHDNAFHKCHRERYIGLIVLMHVNRQARCLYPSQDMFLLDVFP